VIANFLRKGEMPNRSEKSHEEGRGLHGLFKEEKTIGRLDGEINSKV